MRNHINETMPNLYLLSPQHPTSFHASSGAAFSSRCLLLVGLIRNLHGAPQTGSSLVSAPT